MLLIFFLGLIVKFTLVSGDCDIGTHDIKDFDWSKVCISVLTQVLKQAAFKVFFSFYISFLLSLTITQ